MCQLFCMICVKIKYIQSLLFYQKMKQKVILCILFKFLFELCFSSKIQNARGPIFRDSLSVRLSFG